MGGNFKVSFYKGLVLPEYGAISEIYCDKVEPVFNSTFLCMSSISDEVETVLAILPMSNIISIESTEYLKRATESDADKQIFASAT